ncbi:PIN domain-like protein [Mycena metata]|uniref:PIN domain-like protein n=1 Tax=Mycena metata TaxID=1033252 RepID=A0AAD7NCH5_9AGAR|nr:PIN domain-like protein [Mycena metata]
MGVSGLTPFLQKSLQVPIGPFYQVIKQLPDRLRGLAGKKIVIDGTLITQRLHFAQVPHDYRHVLGWYRLVKELQDSGVSAICVFDGKERSAAKARESERRRELDRVKRLDRLGDVMDRFQELNKLDKGRVSELLKQISAEPKLPASLEKEKDVLGPLDLPGVTEVPQPPAPPLDVFLDALDPVVETPVSTPTPPPQSQEEFPKITPTPTPVYNEPSPPSTPSTQQEHSTLTALASLYLDFRDSLQKLASLTPVPPPRAADFANKEEQQDARVEYSMTKGQIQLTADEAKLWQELAVPSSAPDAADETTRTTEATLAELSFRANVMSESYQRRNNPPTTQTYDESKELLRTMGLPCIDTTGTYEAEALASSLVLNGFADYVASEDTDVIVYEAPLIRNITNRNVPLVMLSGTEIRAALQLDRSSFIDFALLLGTDFSQRIKNVGPVRALKFIRQHKSIERVIEVETKYEPRVPPPAYLAEVEIARLVFQTLPPVPDAKLLEQEKDDEALPTLLQRFGLGRLLMGQEESVFEDALQGNYFSDDPSASPSTAADYIE